MTLKRFFLGFLLVLNVFLGYRLIAGDTGMFAYFELRDRYERMERTLIEAQERSRELSREIRSLKSDRGRVEDEIRVRMNYVDEGETLYLFPDEPGADSETSSVGAGKDDDQN